MFLGKFCSQNFLCNAAFTFWLSIKEKNLNFLWNVSTDCRNFLGKSNKLIYCNSEFYLFMIMFLCVHDHVFMSFHEYEQACCELVCTCICARVEKLIYHFYVTDLSLFALKTSGNLPFLKDDFSKKIRYSHPSSQTHTHIHRHTHTLKYLQSKESQMQRRIQFFKNS